MGEAEVVSVKPLGKMGEYDPEFGRLLDAVLREPHKVRDIVTDNRDILWATNRVGENVLAWLCVENHFEGVKLLRSLGSPIPDFSLWEAIQAGQTEMVILLLELGVAVDIEVCRSSLHNPFFHLDKKNKRLITSYFSQYGYEI
jgi:hypothetical protein